MKIYSIRTLKNNPTRLLLTIIGIALCTILILYLFSIYKGVEEGSIEYIRKNETDFWILQRNATNILRGTSFLYENERSKLIDIKGVADVSPVLLILSTIKLESSSATLFLAGYEVDKGIGGPPNIIQGRLVKKDKEIVLDNSFARKNRFNLEDRIVIQSDTFIVVGLSSGTNAFVMQYGFISLDDARRLVGIPNLVTVYLVGIEENSHPETVKNGIIATIPNIEVLSHTEFLRNNINEMESGFLPLLYSVAIFGAVVLTIILSLLLSINILERRKDFAVMKILGSPKYFLHGLVINQSLIISLTGCIIGLILFFPIVNLIEYLSPEVSTITSYEQIVSVAAIVLLVSIISSLISIRRLRKIYPIEVFYEG